MKITLIAFIMGGVLLLESFSSFALSPNLPCRLRNSNYCKNPKYFEKDLKDKCASPKTNCRQKFCKHNCFNSDTPAKENKIYKLCQLHCDPQELTTLSRDERLLFQKRFEDKTVRRKHEVTKYIDSLLSRLPWCEGECDYDENAPQSCKSKHIKAPDHWAVCAQNCYFIKDIKEHAERCAQRPPTKPKPKITRLEKSGNSQLVIG